MPWSKFRRRSLNSPQQTKCLCARLPRARDLRFRVAPQYGFGLRGRSKDRDDDRRDVGADRLTTVAVVHQQPVAVRVVVEAVDAEAVDRFEVHGRRAQTNRDEPHGASPSIRCPAVRRLYARKPRRRNVKVCLKREEAAPMPTCGVAGRRPYLRVPTKHSHSLVQAAPTTTRGYRIGRTGTVPAQLRPMWILDGHRGTTQPHRLDAPLHALRMRARCPRRCATVSCIRRRRQPIRQPRRRKVSATQAAQYARRVCDVACEAAIVRRECSRALGFPLVRSAVKSVTPSRSLAGPFIG